MGTIVYLIASLFLGIITSMAGLKIDNPYFWAITVLFHLTIFAVRSADTYDNR